MLLAACATSPSPWTSSSAPTLPRWSLMLGTTKPLNRWRDLGRDLERRLLRRWALHALVCAATELQPSGPATSTLPLEAQEPAGGLGRARLLRVARSDARRAQCAARRGGCLGAPDEAGRCSGAGLHRRRATAAGLLVLLVMSLSLTWSCPGWGELALHAACSAGRGSRRPSTSMEICRLSPSGSSDGTRRWRHRPLGCPGRLRLATKF